MEKNISVAWKLIAVAINVLYDYPSAIVSEKWNRKDVSKVIEKDLMAVGWI